MRPKPPTSSLSQLGWAILETKRRRALVLCADDPPRFWELTRQINALANRAAREWR